LGVIYIGDRYVGKTHLALELANPSYQYVKVLSPEYQVLKSLLWDFEENTTKLTDADSPTRSEQIEIHVKLPVPKQILVEWIDTPGEIWRSSWQQSNPDKWENFLSSVRESSGIIVVLSPYREMIGAGKDADLFLTQKQWCNRFERWTNFLADNFPNLKHLLFCMNKADLFCNYQQESAKLKYNPRGSSMKWHERNSYVSQRYFRVIKPYLERITNNNPNLAIRCFITTIHDRSLLELPWLYLGSFLE
jgi:GTPase SAR1 family protein